MKLFAWTPVQMNMWQEPANNPVFNRLSKRARCLQQARFFFDSRGYIEVDSPLLSKGASIDEHIDLIEATMNGERLFLITSPEYALKRLLAEGAPNCYQISHVFRSGEISAKHSPEFTMAEWYQLDNPSLSAEANFQALISETLDFIQLFTGLREVKRYTYFGLFKEYIGLDLGKNRETDLFTILSWLKKNQDHPPLNEKDGLEAYLSYLISYHIEPKMNPQELHVIEAFPQKQASLATTYELNGSVVAHRFEVYLGDLELANGYHELTDSIEQRQRLILSQQNRFEMGKDPLILDEKFIKSLETLPACSGVAVGFDRLMMIHTNQKEIGSVQALGWSNI
jgi:lysyl-tRNA synthetase class 2